MNTELEILRELCDVPKQHETDGKTEFYPFTAMTLFWERKEGHVK
jgi:hypothetical protein